MMLGVDAPAPVPIVGGSAMPRAPESTLASQAVGEFAHFLPLDTFVSREHGLRNSVSATDLEWLTPQVDDQYLDLTTEILVDRPRRIDHRDAMS